MWFDILKTPSLFGAIWWGRLTEVVLRFYNSGGSDMGGLMGTCSFKFCLFFLNWCCKYGKFGSGSWKLV